ncbi:histone H1-like repetitive region-containing protein (plasmid) [Acinetobacter baumannii]
MQSMNLTKLSAAIILALSTAACSSGGSHSTTSTSPVITEQTAAEKAAAEKAAAEKAAAEKAAAEKAAAEKAAAEKAAAEKAAAEKAAAEKAAAEKAAAEKAAAEKAAAEKAAAEKAAAEKAAAEKAAAEKAAAEKAAAEKAAAEKAAAEKAAAEKAAAEKAAAEKAAAEKAAAEKAAAEKAAAEKQKEIDDAKGLTSYYPINTITANSNGGKATTNNLTKASGTQSVVYNQPYSVVLGNYSGDLSYNNKTGALISDDRTSNIKIQGLKTTVDAIPTLGTATYTGKAFNGAYIDTTTIDYSGMIPSISTTSKLAEGTLDYNINFTDRLGSGSITGLGNTISLEQGSISGTGITSTAKQLTNTGTYSLDFYGKKAEEIAGKVIFNGKDTVGFGGTRGEITK